MQSYLAEMIRERKFSDEKDEKRDLLSNLINANEELLDDGEVRLGEIELIGTRDQHLVYRPSVNTPAVQETFSYSTLLDTR